MLEMVETDVIKRSVFDVLHYPLDGAYIFTYKWMVENPFTCCVYYRSHVG